MREKNTQWEKIVFKTRKEVQEHFKEIYSSLDFGAYLEPENYFVSYIFRTTEELNMANHNGLLVKINNYHKICMYNNEYPENAIKDCTFASQEECEKQYNGNWYYYYN